MKPVRAPLRGVLPFAILMGGITALLTACPPGSIPVSELRDDHPECPTDSVTGITVLDSTHGHDSASFKTYHTLPLSGAATFIPEYNDCQRFPVDGKAYGPLVAIFAVQSLDTVIKTMYDLASQQPAPAARAFAIANVLDWGSAGYAGSGDYTSLGIVRGATGFNCLYMWAEIKRHVGPGNPNAKDTSRFAFMIRSPVTDGGCAPVLETAPTGSHPLSVAARQTNPPHGKADHAGVARWDWDARNKVQYIVIGCLDMWCDISDPSKTLSASGSHDDPAQGPAERRPRRLKEYYDEEYLAEPGPPGGPKLVQGQVLGTIFPDKDLKNINDHHATSYDNQWVRVARVLLSMGSITYQKKLNFYPPPVFTGGATFDDSLNVVDLCHGTFDNCAGPGATPPLAACPNGADPWWARITPPKGVPAYRCVIRRQHPNMEIPGMVRWRWTIADQQGWIACPLGCCEVIEDP